MKRVRIYLLIFAFLLLPALNVARAAVDPGTTDLSNNYVENDFAPAMKAALKNNELNSVGYRAHGMNSDMKNVIRLIGGCIPGITCDLNERDTSYIQQLEQQSALGGISNTIAFLYVNPPAHTADFAIDMGKSLGFIPRSAYAQGIGFSGFAPLLPIWKAFRNLAYLLVAIVMMVVGFMVMLRKKIDPKTVITVQNSLPRIIFVLLLITFSYAIAGLMIDLMYLFIALGVGILNSSFTNGATPSIFGVKADLINGGFIDLLWAVFAPLVNNAGLTGTAVNNFQLATSGQWGQLVQNAIFGTGLAVVTLGGSVVLGVLLQFLSVLAFLFAFIRIFLMLLSAYIQIIISVIFGPIQLLMDALPGGEGFSSWLKNLFINLIPFPITIFLLMLGSAIAGTNTSGPLWQPPFLPQTGGGVGGFAVTVIWFGFITAIPSIVGSIKEALKTKPFISTGPGAIIGPIGAGAGQLLTLGYQLKFLTAGKPPVGTTPLERTRAAADAGKQGKL